MDFTEHLIISSAGSASALAGGAGWESAAAFTLAGVFIDFDHLPDYWHSAGFNADIPRFMSFFSLRRNRTMFFLLHGWEWPLLLAGLALAWGWPAWVLWGAGGWFIHLVLDQRFNRLHRFAYLFSFRLYCRFDSNRLHVVPKDKP